MGGEVGGDESWVWAGRLGSLQRKITGLFWDLVGGEQGVGLGVPPGSLHSVPAPLRRSIRPG